MYETTQQTVSRYIKKNLEIQEEIKINSRNFKKNLNNKDWINEQIANGVPEEVITIMKVFTK